jgi:hypothetical protein
LSANVKRKRSRGMKIIFYMLTGCPEYSVQDRVEALAALLQRVGVIPLTQGFTLHSIEW